MDTGSDITIPVSHCNPQTQQSLLTQNAAGFYPRFSNRKTVPLCLACCLDWRHHLAQEELQKMEGKKKRKLKRNGERDPQTPMVSKVAQQAEHYAFSNSKCCWQAGWLLAGEGPSASLPQIQTSHTVDICNGTTNNTADRTSPSHKINNVHAVFTENATFFYTPIPTLSVFCSAFWRQMLCERHDVPVGSEMWIHLTMQFKEIH